MLINYTLDAERVYYICNSVEQCVGWLTAELHDGGHRTLENLSTNNDTNRGTTSNGTMENSGAMSSGTSNKEAPNSGALAAETRTVEQLSLVIAEDGDSLSSNPFHASLHIFHDRY